MVGRKEQDSIDRLNERIPEVIDSQSQSNRPFNGSLRNTATLFKRSFVQRGEDQQDELNQSLGSKRQKLDDSMSFFKVQEEL